MTQDNLLAFVKQDDLYYGLIINRFKQIPSFAAGLEGYKAAKCSHCGFLSFTCRVVSLFNGMVGKQLYELPVEEAEGSPQLPAGLSSLQKTEISRLQLSENVDLGEIHTQLVKAQTLLFQRQPECKQIIAALVPQIKDLASRIRQGNELARLVPQQERRALGRAIEMFSQAFSNLAHKVNEIDLNQSSARPVLR